MQYKDLKGLAGATRAMMIAAVGHPVLIVADKPVQMLAELLPSIMPTMTDDEIEEVADIWLRAMRCARACRTRPVRAPHLTIAQTAMVGTGKRPGELSLAHRGVLTLVDMTEFRQAAFSAVLYGHQTKTIRGFAGEDQGGPAAVDRPANFLTVGIVHRCPCRLRHINCMCSPKVIDIWRRRTTGCVITSMFDLRVRAVGDDDDWQMSTDEMRERVARAAELRDGRQGSDRDAVLDHACLTEGGQAWMLTTAGTGHALTRLLTVARTIADLDGHSQVDCQHLDEAFDLGMLKL